MLPIVQHGTDSGGRSVAGGRRPAPGDGVCTQRGWGVRAAAPAERAGRAAACPREQHRMYGMSSTGESARYWESPQLPGVDLLQARYISKTFTRHTHETYVIAAITEGVEAFHHGGSVYKAGPGSLALINPDTLHTGHAGAPGGWRYEVLYPDPQLVARIAAETTSLRGTPGFTAPAFHDPVAARWVQEVHRAVDEGNALAADSVLHSLVARLLRRNGGPLPARAVHPAGAAVARQARELLETEMADPPALEALARRLGTSPFALSRAFRAAYGLPPHAWLTTARVHRARRLLDAGLPPAEAATAVGFTDQPHLTRHFGRVLGIPPGAYQRGRARTYKTREDVRS